MTPIVFARRIRVFGSLAVLILCVVFFLVPFSLRGARKSLERMENNVKDWLPKEFPETKELDWFGQHFVGERFVLITWPGCTEDDPRFELLVKKLHGEVVTDQGPVRRPDAELAGRAEPTELERARQMGDRLGLFATGNYYQDWGGRGEKWLLGDHDAWYFITPRGELYRWDGEANVWGWLCRSVERLLTGKNSADGQFIATVGSPAARDALNQFHADPRKLTARFFKTVTTGPDVLRQLTAEGGPLWPRGNVSDREKPGLARRSAMKRLTGTLFGPAVSSGFTWEPSDFRHRLPQDKLSELPQDWEAILQKFVDRVVEKEYGGDRQAFFHASLAKQSEHWDELFAKLAVDPPPRPTCIIVTLSEAGKRDMRRVIGRPLMGKPAGKLLDLAVNECNVSLDELKLGGPPVDNVAIDEEGTVTLFRLIGWSAALGLGLSYLCFRSIKVTTMVFFVGGVAAVTSLSIVWWCGASVDAVLMSMPSLVYVLGLSGAVHIVNYYREAAERHGVEGAPERALSHGWGPCTLAAFTTALGLISLYASNLMPIKKFGLYSAIGVMATLVLLFCYLPSALQIWPPGYHKRRDEAEKAGPTGFAKLAIRFWESFGGWIVRRHLWVTAGCLLLMVAVGLGLRKINTSVQLLKLFDADAKIIRDYSWLEANFGKLVPMELVIRVHPKMMLPMADQLNRGGAEEKREARFQLNFLQRMELAARVQGWVETAFGEDGQDIVGRGMSAATFVPELPAPSFATARNPTRLVFNTKLDQGRDDILRSDYLRIDQDKRHRGSELWRISLRLGALNDVDYGQFVHRQKLVVEPVLSAYRYRERLLRKIDEQAGGKGYVGKRVLFLGVSKPADEEQPAQEAETPPGQAVAGLAVDASAGSVSPAAAARRIDQTRIFASTLKDLLTIAGCKSAWHDPQALPLDAGAARSDEWADYLKQADCVVLARNHKTYDLDFVRQHAGLFVDATDHEFQLGSAGAKTAAQRDDPIQVVYTGVVPVVYKAQRTLLNSLVNSIALAFLMIALVMTVLLRDWAAPLSLTNGINVSAGLLSMIPNLFPVVLIFGAMGHMGLLVDIGTMMCASVGMGVAVDDTIHFLSWFRNGIRQGMDRKEAILDAYRRVATAMMQTTLIGGLGLAVFALSTFTPTQRFGVMMVTLLATALVGDLILLPALLAGPLGRSFCPRPKENASADPPQAAIQLPPGGAADEARRPRLETLHSAATAKDGMMVRRDQQHPWPRH